MDADGFEWHEAVASAFAGERRRVGTDMREPGSGRDQTTKRPLCARARGVNQYAAAVKITPSPGAGQGVNPFL